MCHRVLQYNLRSPEGCITIHESSTPIGIIFSSLMIINNFISQHMIADDRNKSHYLNFIVIQTCPNKEEHTQACIFDSQDLNSRILLVLTQCQHSSFCFI